MTKLNLSCVHFVGNFRATIVSKDYNAFLLLMVIYLHLYVFHLEYLEIKVNRFMRVRE